jgi:hypothetical protein
VTSTTQEIADALHMDRSDVDLLIDALAEDRVDHDDVADWMSTMVHRTLDPNGERTVPAQFYPGLDPDVGSGATKMRYASL